MPSLTATYTSPTSTEPKVFSSELPALSSPPSTQDRVAYLAALGSSLKGLQGDINAFLTQKMEEDKAKGASTGDDATLEETYGEEVVDED
ncbi:hypothetical protein EK21DRAFT_52782 [Setomelanomma holmii]|uniref:EKC/KEOPS complex subunit GON7 n=1 Tax=Setomelanomma holmii TaxID=210430 RepID=A0A9P4LQI3_9PLEO|nr:hypothetical protein EK21DRAFT_52782 [Setomelanomma holmii]